MKATILCFALAFLSYAVFAEELLDAIPEDVMPEVTKMGIPEKRCRVDICFAIEGSDNIAKSQFGIQRTIVRRVVRRLSRENKIKVAAVQYGIINSVISPLTENVTAFFQDLASETFLDSSLSTVGAGVVYCHAQLRNSPPQRQKMVLLGTGKNDIGGSPAVRANNFRKDGGEVFVVGVGAAKIGALRKIADGPRNVFSIDTRDEIPALVQAFLSTLCN